MSVHARHAGACSFPGALHHALRRGGGAPGTRGASCRGVPRAPASRLLCSGPGVRGNFSRLPRGVVGKAPPLGVCKLWAPEGGGARRAGQPASPGAETKGPRARRPGALPLPASLRLFGAAGKRAAFRRRSASGAAARTVRGALGGERALRSLERVARRRCSFPPPLWSPGWLSSCWRGGGSGGRRPPRGRWWATRGAWAAWRGHAGGAWVPQPWGGGSRVERKEAGAGPGWRVFGTLNGGLAFPQCVAPFLFNRRFGCTREVGGARAAARGAGASRKGRGVQRSMGRARLFGMPCSLTKGGSFPPRERRGFFSFVEGPLSVPTPLKTF